MARKKKTEAPSEVIATKAEEVVASTNRKPDEPEKKPEKEFTEKVTAEQVKEVSANITQKEDKTISDKASTLPINEFKCDMCRKVFTDKEQLIKHKVVCPMNNRFDM